MGFGKRFFLSLILAAVCMVADSSIGNAEAKSENDISKSSFHTRDREIRELSERVSELNKKLAEADYRSAKEDEELNDLNKKISELKDTIADSKKISFDSTSSVLNTLIALSTLIITGIGLGFGYLAFHGIKGYGEIKTEMHKELTSESEKLDAKFNLVAEKLNDNISSRYKVTIDEYFKSQNSPIREKLDELEGRINECCDKANTAASVKNILPATQPTQSGNAFNDV